MSRSSTPRSPLRRAARAAGAPFRAVGRFAGWVRHSSADTEAVYGPDPNELSDEERLARAAIIGSGIGLSGGGGAAGSGMA